MKTSSVGVRELKSRLGLYLGRVRNGERLIVTDRGEPAAEIGPIRPPGTSVAAKLAALEAEGLVTRPCKPGLAPFRPARIAGPSLADAIIEEREAGW